jgi:predicted nucleic acid-binding protein
MRHVFVETNWVVAYAAPTHLQVPAALTLARKAEAGDIRLHLPSVCLTEARRPIQTKYHPRRPADSLRNYLAWATTSKKLSVADNETARRVIDQYESAVLS